jgi:hypothetical protein
VEPATVVVESPGAAPATVVVVAGVNGIVRNVVWAVLTVLEVLELVLPPPRLHAPRRTPPTATPPRARTKRMPGERRRPASVQ